MTDNAKTNISALDFNDIKSNLKTYLASQDRFVDYDFEGSGLAVLVDVLSYNTHYNSFYANMVHNESYLDSAVKRDSVVSKAKTVGYIPRSMTAATALVNITIVPDDTPVTIDIPKGTQFTSTIDDVTYVFVTTEAHIAINDGTGNYIASDVPIRQGRYITFSYTFQSALPDQRFLLNNKNVDLSTLNVSVQKSFSDTTTEYYDKVEDITQYDGTSLIYYVEEAESEKHEVFFGNDVIGKQLSDGNIIILEYIVTEGPDANKASSFAVVGDISGYSSVSVVTSSVATGGAEIESIEEIKFSAPRSYQVQNRAVTENDYKQILLSDTNVTTTTSSINVWGGEKNDPPEYGTVFISLNVAEGSVISQSLKNRIIEEVIDDKNIIGLSVKFTEPEYIYLDLVVDFIYDEKLTSRTKTQLENLVIDTIKNYNVTTLEKFDSTFRYSALSTLIDSTEKSILNNLYAITMNKRIVPLFNTNVSYNINFVNGIEAGTLRSSQFVVSEPTRIASDVYYFKDDEAGNIQLIKLKTDFSETIIDAEYGTVNYNTGKVVLSCLNPVSVIGTTSYINIEAEPLKNDVMSERNLILRINDSDITVNGTPKE